MLTFFLLAGAGVYLWGASYSNVSFNLYFPNPHLTIILDFILAIMYIVTRVN